jgi:hypothetical protein
MLNIKTISCILTILIHAIPLLYIFIANVYRPCGLKSMIVLVYLHKYTTLIFENHWKSTVVKCRTMSVFHGNITATILLLDAETISCILTILIHTTPLLYIFTANVYRPCGLKSTIVLVYLHKYTIVFHTPNI